MKVQIISHIDINPKTLCFWICVCEGQKTLYISVENKCYSPCNFSRTCSGVYETVSLSLLNSTAALLCVMRQKIVKGNWKSDVCKTSGMEEMWTLAMADVRF